MGNRIRGITVEFDGDASGIGKALKGVNSEAKNVEKQLKDVEKLLKLDPTNTELLRQKQALLAKSVETTRSKVDELRKAEQAMKDAGVDQNSAQFMALQREIISTENELDNLEGAARRSNVALEKIGATAEKISGGAKKVADATRALSGAAGGALGGLVTAGVAASAAADDYNTLAKQTGLSTETLQEAKYAADLIDVSYEDFTGSITKMVGKLRTNEDGFTALGIATRDANGELLGTEDIFWNAAEALSEMDNETERDIAAQELFGKSAAELAGILDDGGEAFRNIGKQAKDAGLIMSQDTLDGLNEINDELDTLKAKAKGTLSVAGAKALEAIAPVLDRIVEKASAILERIGDMSPEQIERIMMALGAVALISPTAGAIGKITDGIGGLIKIWPQVSGIAAKVAGFVAENPITLIAGAIVALVALIATKGDEIQGILQKVDDFLQGVFAKDWTEIFGPVMGEILNGFFANFKNVWGSVKQVLDGVIDIIRGVFTGDWKRAWEGVKEVFSGIFKGLLSVVKAPLNGIITMLNGVIDGVNWVIKGLNKLPNVNIGEVGNIPYLASGGILSRGSAIVGEAGPELLTMAAGKAYVQPLDGNGPNLGTVEGLLGNIRDSIGDSGSPIHITVQNVLDGKVIGESNYDYTERRMRTGR